MNNKSDGKTDPTPKKHGPGFIAAAFIALVVSLVTTIGLIAIYDRRYAQKIVTMDLKGYIREQRDKAISGAISDEELRKNIDAMEAALLAAPPNHVVLLKEVVLRNAGEIKP
ncbi:MAG: hypothetical protein KKA54_13125 [Proteobacteria bacterium]|nr:hypothetical protein [Pseudomonadota bacterium]